MGLGGIRTFRTRWLHILSFHTSNTMKVLIALFALALVLLLVLSTMGGSVNLSPPAEEFFDANGMMDKSRKMNASTYPPVPAVPTASMTPTTQVTPSGSAAAAVPTGAAVPAVPAVTGVPAVPMAPSVATPSTTFGLPTTGHDMKVVEPFSNQDDDDSKYTLF